MSKSDKHHFNSHWKRIVSTLLVVLVVIGLFPISAFATEAEETSAYAPTGDFELNVAGATGWNGTRFPLPVYAAETGNDEMVTVPASDEAGPVPFVILQDNGGDRVLIGLVGDADGNVVAWEASVVDGTGWVDKEYIFINLPDVVPGIAYNLTNAGGSVFTAAGGTEIPDVTGKEFYPQAMQFNPRLGREEYIVPCMYTLAQRLAKAQKSAMSNGDTLVIYETFRPAEVQSAVRDGLRSLIASDSTVSADMKKASSMGYGEGWFISSGVSHHQSGLAVDVSLAKGDASTLQEYEMNGTVYRKYESWTEYDMPSRMHELSSAAIRFKTPADSNAMPSNLENWTDSFAASEGAKRLQIYCTTAGLIPLSSEWWHFNDPNAAKISAKGVYSRENAVNTKGGYTFDRIDSVTPMTALTILIPWAVTLDEGPTGGAGGLNPGSPGGSKPGSNNVSWATLSGRTFLRFTLIEFPKGVVTDLNSDDYSTWHTVGTPLNVMWSKDSGGTTYDGTYARNNIMWYNSNAMRYNSIGANAPSLMAGPGAVDHGVYIYSAAIGHNQRWVMTADEFQADTGISDSEKEQMFNLASSSWSTGWLNGDYTSMWGTDPQPVTPGNLYTVYTPNKAFLYLLNRLSETEKNDGTVVPGWSEDEAIANWSRLTKDDAGNNRTMYRITVETGAVITDPDGNRRAMTLRDVMAYSLYNEEENTRYHLIYDQTPTSKNMAQWMRQAITQFVEYPLGSDGMPTGEELFSTNGFTEADSFVDSIESVRTIRDKIFSERRSFGLHIFSPFNFVMPTPEPTNVTLEVTKKVGSGITDGGSWGFTVKYTAGTPTGFTATKNGADCKSEITETGSGLQFTLKADETVKIVFEADDSFRFEVSEDDPTDLKDITGTGGTADKANNKFTSDGSASSKVTFTNDREEIILEKKPVYLKLKKIAKSDGSPLSGAVFSVYDNASCSGAVLATLTTGGDGTATASIPNIVEDGGSVTLYVKETSAPSGYEPLETAFTVTCTAPANSTEAGAVQVGPADGIVNTSTTKEGPDDPILYKRDALTNGGVGPATFKFSSVTNGVYEFTTDEDGKLEPIQWWDPTEAEGRYIKPGEYAVTEIIPPPGYEPTSEVQQIKLELDADGNGIPAGPLVFKNLQKVGLRIVKYDRLTHKPMEGVTFEIYKDGLSIGRYETKANGEILLTDLDPGTYRVVVRP